jgi:hypothetical protein
MNRFDEEMMPYYQRYDDALMKGDKKEIAYLAQFCTEKDPEKWKPFRRRQICENMRSHDQMKTFGYTEVRLNDAGWYEWKFPNYERQEFIRLGVEINRGCCNTKEAKAVGVLQVANGNWVAEVSDDFTSICTSVVYLGCYRPKQYATRNAALNAALQQYIDRWKKRNPDVKKEDQAVRNARSLMAGGAIDLSEKPKRQPKPKAQPKQQAEVLSLADRLRAALMERLAA